MTIVLPLISVIIPVYNVEKYLSQCLDSVIGQTYQNLEIIIIDDGSTDNSGKMCDIYAQKDPRVQVIHQNNAGVSAARNMGLKTAKGAYIGFVDADDYIRPDMYEYLYQLITQDNANIAMCNWYSDGLSVTNPINTAYRLIPASEIFVYGHYPNPVNKLFRAKLLENQWFDPEITYGEDAFFIFELIKKGGMIALGNGNKYYYRQHVTSARHKFTPKHLNRIRTMETCTRYAKEHHWDKWFISPHETSLEIAATWLGWLALQSSRDETSVRFLLSYIRKNFWNIFREKRIKFFKKCFIIVACINFNLARKIYLTYQKLCGQR